MSNKETYLGDVQDVNGINVSIVLSRDSLTGFVYIDGQGYRAGQIGSFVRIPIGYSNLYGIVSQVGASAVPGAASELMNANGNRWMRVQLIGEGQRTGAFSRGLSQYPTVGDSVHLVSEKELRNIYGQPDRPYFFRIGHIANADSIPALIDINKLVTRHSAVLGTTGSGKSTTVASIINALSDSARYPSSRIVMLDLHGEYGNALRGRSNVYKINADKSERSEERDLHIPFWALSFDELSKVCFGDFNNEKDRNLVMERVHRAKLSSLVKYPRLGAALDTLSVDSPIPFCIHHLWHELFLETFATYYSKQTGRPLDNIAYERDANGVEMKGNPLVGVPPVFKNVKNEKDDDEKINYLPGALNLGKQLLLLGSKLRIPRYNFLFRPGSWSPESDGKIVRDLDGLLEDWIGGRNPVSVLDLSGVPQDILQTTIGAVLRLLYEALFWSRNLSQGGRHRPLLIVMEEAHIYLGSKGDHDELASSVVRRIVKEGRKYGIGAMIVSQRPSEIDQTILSQCGTFFALRLANSVDRGHVTGALSDNLEGLTNMLPILRTGEAIILGEAVKLPMRTLIEPPPKNARPDSQDPVVFDEVSSENSMNPGGWGIPKESNPNFEEVSEVWRAQNPRISRIKQ